jgi:hypothetical protein
MGQLGSQWADLHEIWVLLEQPIEKIEVSFKSDKVNGTDMKFFRRTAECALFFFFLNDEILEEMKVVPADEKIRRYKSNWLRHVTRMNNNRISKIMLKYGPNGQRRLGRPWKRLLDEAETGTSRLNS